jgi:flavin-dependent dehydrogenase
MNKVWGPRPLNLAVVEVLQRKGPLADDDLLDEVKDNYGELSFRELNSALLKLELNGVLRVTRLMKGKRRVELVSIKSMRRLGIQLPEKIIKNQIRGATFHSPSGQTLRLERRTPITWVLDRRVFDEHLANRASKAGAEILLNCRALSMRTTEPTTVEVRVSSKEKPGTIRGNVVVGSLGAHH